MKVQSFAWLLAGSLVLAACGQQPVPEVVQDDIQPLSDLASSSSLGGSSANAVSLKPSTCDEGSSQQVTITYSITGPQGGTSTFQVPTVWTYNGTSWTSGTPVTVSVPERKNNAAATVRTVDVTVTNSSSRNSGSSSFIITPSNPTNAKSPNLDISNGDSTIHVAFNACPVTNTAPWLNVPEDFNVEAGSASGAVVNFARLVTAGDAEDESVNVACTPASGSTFELGRTTVNCSVKDSGNLTTSGSFVITVQDNTAPTLTDLGPTTRPNDAGWYNSAVTNNFKADDAVGFAAPLTNPHTFTKSSGTAEGDAVRINSGLVSDAAGNEAQGINSDAFQIDLSDPNVVCGATPTFTLGQSNATVSATVTDNTSGPVNESVSVAAATGTVGGGSVQVTGEDIAGRSRTVTCAYNVVYNFTGFFSPVDMNGVYNVAKAGSAIPVKFKLGGDQGLNIFATGYPKAVAVSCSTSAPSDSIEETVTANASGLKYDATADQYNYTWKTGSWAGSCRRLDVQLVDGKTYSALFKFNK
jgi:hypothetical protein